ncbi:sensor histidine kinase [Oceaniovalibus sp. ACAM 378]|uniref:sensor histidine kinase n=1 Tax=Oceaniovalibus sp. ACAM 378 TaxID=2599923 RepID=UPI0011DB7190|nr:sensor histidine kinase [Oceaniovalibus sp. ACAM 378]TYB83695.1 PAS domain-containing protein [Oceaniovalibus sp. ACAM 378]
MLSREFDHTNWGYKQLRAAVDAAGVALWSWDINTDTFTMDPHGYELWDVPRGQALTFERLSEKIHPSDRDRVREAFSATKAVKGAYEIDFRTLLNGDVRWISARGHSADIDIDGQAMTGIFIDISGRKHAEEGNELLAGEMSHRVKNLLAIAAALTKMTSRSSSSTEDMSKQLTHRLIALGRAHDLVRPLPGSQGKAALLGDLFTVLLSPYDDDGAFAGRIRVAVPRMGIGEAGATGLALIVHELATNSLKYGALSSEVGTLDISGSQEGDDVSIIWKEHGGPTVTAPLKGDGYGSKLIRQTMEAQFGGEIIYDWPADGLIVTLLVSVDQLST